MSEPDREFFAWLAGFWEGEGSIFSGKYNTILSICQKEKAPLTLIKSKLGGSVYHHSRTTNFPPHNPIWRWQLTFRKDIIRVLELMYPHLKFKQDKVLGVLETIKKKERKRPSQRRQFKSKPRPWTKEEDEFVKQHHKGMLDWEIASILQRTPESIRARRHIIGVHRGLKESMKLRDIKHPEYVQARVSLLHMARRLSHPSWKWKGGSSP